MFEDSSGGDSPLGMTIVNGPLTRGGLKLYMSAVGFGDRLHDREPEPRSVARHGLLAGREALEDPLLVLGRDPVALVPNPHAHVAVGERAADRDRIVAARVADGVLGEVHHGGGRGGVDRRDQADVGLVHHPAAHAEDPRLAEEVVGEDVE